MAKLSMRFNDTIARVSTFERKAAQPDGTGLRVLRRESMALDRELEAIGKEAEGTPLDGATARVRESLGGLGQALASATGHEGIEPAPPGSGLHATQDGRLFVLNRRTHASIAKTRTSVATIKTEIAGLENANDQKQQIARNLVSQIEDRKEDIEDSQRRKLGIGILFGGLVGAASLSMAIDDDHRIADLTTRLQTARREQTEIANKLQRHISTKGVLEQHLGKLERIETDLDSQIVELSKPADKSTTIDRAQANLRLSRGLLGNLRSQVTILDSIKGSAADLGVSLDAHVTRLNADVAHAEKLVADSTKAFVDLLKIVISPNPQAAARDYLKDEIKSKVADRLKQAGLGPEAAKMLAKQLFAKTSDQDEFSDAVSAQL